MMKQIIKRAVAFVTLLCMCFVMPVCASESISAKAVLNLENNMLTVSGTVASAKGSVPMLLQIKQGETVVDMQQAVSGASQNGYVSFSFPSFYIPSDSTDSSYSVYVSADYVNAEYSFNFDYVGAAGRLAAMQAVNDGIGGGALALSAAIKANLSALGINSADYLSLSPEAQLLLATKLKAFGSYTLPQTVETAEEIETLTKAVQSFAGHYNECFMIAQASDIATADDLARFISLYGENQKLFTEESSTAYSEEMMSVYFKEAQNYTSLCAKVAAAAKSSDDAKSFKDAMLRAGIVTLLEEGRYTKLQEIVEALPELFDKIDQTAYARVNKNNLPKMYQTLTDNTYASIDDFATALNSAVKTALSSNSGSGSGSSSGGSGGGNSSKKSEVVVGTNVITAVSQKGFEDLTNYAWAETAVYALADKGIIAGRSANTFDPGAQVTRAEFVKMIVGALQVPSADYDGRFKDVSADDWFAPYVAAAAAAGIAEGSGDTFDPNACITREDMAVLLFRALKFESADDARAVFYDTDEISGYAIEAVYALYQQGIVSGVGEGYFAPKKPASRAEAAQMIYKALV